MNTTIKQLRKLFLLICLITAGVQSAWGDDYFWLNDVQYYIFNGTYSYVHVVSYTGDAETLTIPASVSDGSNTYSVKDIKIHANGTPVDISSVRTLIIEGNKRFMSSSEAPTFNCPNLEKIIFKGDLPTLTNSFNDYFGTRRGIIAYVTGKTVEEVEQLKNNTAVWCDFEDIVIYHEGDENLEGTAAFIPFKDDNVKALCVNAGWDTNGDGKISMAEAAAVTSLGTVFKWNTDITSFNELQYFTGLTKINSSAFALCSNLASVILPETLTEIEHNAFEGCKKLTSIVFPEGLTAIGYSAFYNCDIKSVFIPASVESIGTNVFGKCRNLTSIVVDDANTVFDSRGGCDAIIVTASNTLKEGCRYTVIPNSVTAIYTSAFRDRGVPELVIPESVTSIGDYAFMCMNSTDNPTYYLKRMEVKWETPLQVDSKVFGTESANYPKQCTLVVPYGCSSAYSSWAQYFKEIVEAEEVVEPSSKPVWIISQSDDCPNVRISILTSNEQSSNQNLTNHFVRWSDEIDPTSQYWLLVAKNTEGRPIRVIKNGVDVTNQFSERSNENYFWYVMDPTANEVWEISYVPLIVKTVGVSNPDLMEITAVHTYTDGSTTPDGFNTSFRRFSFDGSEGIVSVRLEVVPEDHRPIRVMRNNEDVTYDYIDYDAGDGEFDYEMVISQNDTWAISYDTSHRQTIILNGNGGVPGLSEFGYEYLAGEYYFNINKGVNYIDLPEYNKVDTDNGWATMTICAREGETFKAVRNGEDVTTKFSSRVLENNNTRIIVYELDDSEIEGGDTQAAFGFQLRDPAVWEITVDDGSGNYDVNGDNKIDIIDVTTLVNKILHP